tara:strand:- start:446 stop:715 length:270 start_codon:yes stop_codon:yes gene_type:complete
MSDTEKRIQYKKEWYNNKSDEWKLELSNKKKKYYLDNRERLHENGKEKITCTCGAEVSKWSMIRHIKTEKHKKNMISLPNENKDDIILI